MDIFCGIWNAGGQAPPQFKERLQSINAVLPAKVTQYDDWESMSLAWHGAGLSVSEGLVFCGRIYNWRELIELLQTKCNNLAELTRLLFARVGVTEGLRRINGVFSLAYAQQNTLILAKDHFGVAPMFYASLNGDVVFSNQLSWLSHYPGYNKKVSEEALSAYITFNWVPANLCIYQGINKIPPGHYVQLHKNYSPQLKCYFDPVQVALAGQSNPSKLSADDAAAELGQLLAGAIECRHDGRLSQSLLLSGGMDSSLLAAFLSQRGKVNAFTIGFREQNFNEAGYARLVAEKLDASYHEQLFDGAAALKLLPRLAGVYEEPFADQSQMPTMAAMLLAADSKEALWLGDGGDEFFMGYPRYLSHARYALPHSPEDGRVALKTYLRHPWRSFLYFGLHQPMNYLDRHRANPEADKLVVNYVAPDLGLGKYNHIYKLNNPSRQAALFDVLTYLPGNGVIKASRLAASLGLAINCPLLDYNLFSFAQKLPIAMLAAGGRGKLIFRNMLYQYFPAQWIDRPKSGFGAPVTQWLQDEFLDFRKSLLDENEIREQGFFNYEQIKRYMESLGSRGSSTGKLWAIMMFQVWAKREGVI